MFIFPNLLDMKKQLLLTLSVALICGLTFLKCSPEVEVEVQQEVSCDCEQVTYLESKYQEETTNTWLLQHIEIERIPVGCQTETNFSVPPIGSVQREVYRIECN